MYIFLNVLVVLGKEPRASGMLDKCSALSHMPEVCGGQEGIQGPPPTLSPQAWRWALAELVRLGWNSPSCCFRLPKQYI